MQTKQVYYEEPYKKELECRVLHVEDKGGLIDVVLDQTIFYPEGGGQPSDRGTLAEARVEYVRMMNGEIVHKVKGALIPGQAVHAVLDWEYRFRYMRVHTAGHVLHDVLMTMFPDLMPVKGGHGKKAFIEYKGIIPESQKTEIEEKVNECVQKDLPVITKFVSLDDLKKECQFVPDTLPKNKPLRMIKIGDFAGMPDGGVQVANTKEIGKIWIAHITAENNNTIVRYGIADE